MVEGAKFNSHDSGSHFEVDFLFEMAVVKKSFIFVAKLKVQVRLSMQSSATYRYHIHVLYNDIKISTFFF